MQCEDTSKLRIPLKEVCQTTDIGCVPITEGKPDCNPQPDELPLAFDPSTTTLWLFRCTDRTWVPFQKFSMCQLNSINLDNIKNICDILQIGVSYNPGSGCRQGTITLAELAEQLLKCIKLQTKTLAITPEGDKLKIWIDGLDALPPFFLKGENIWTEGGDGTEGNPLKVVTHDPICKWPVRTQAQVNAASTRHLGACLDGTMARVPYPPSPCEFPQTTAERVEASRDKDMIVCVDGENAKVPIPDGLLTPICENPQISVNQAKAKPKLRIVACEDGQIVLFPLPPGMFDTEYMCVPFIDGVPSGPPAEGTGPIRFDCNDDIWFWVCEENRWHRIDVGNHYHPPWKQVYDYIANRCENIKFHGWSEQDECYTDFEMTPQELADFILCECLDPITPEQVNAAIGRGEEAKHQICVNGVSKKIDWSICSRPEMSPTQIDQAINDGKEAKTAICVDGKNYKTSWGNCALPYLSGSDLDNIIDDDGYEAVNIIACVDEPGGKRNRKIPYGKCVDIFSIESYNNFPRVNSRDVNLNSCNLVNSGDEDSPFKVAVYCAWNQSWVEGSGTFERGLEGDVKGMLTFDITNDSNCRMAYDIALSCNLVTDTEQRSNNYTAAVVAGLSTGSFQNWRDFTSGSYAPGRKMASCNWSSKQEYNQDWWTNSTGVGTKHYKARVDGVAMQSTYGYLDPGETIKYYVNMFLIISSQSSSLSSESRYLVDGFASYVDVRKYYGVRALDGVKVS